MAYEEHRITLFYRPNFSPESNSVRARSPKVLALALDTSLEVTKREFILTPHLILRATLQLPLGVFNCKTCPAVIGHDHKQPRGNWSRSETPFASAEEFRVCLNFAEIFECTNWRCDRSILSDSTLQILSCCPQNPIIDYSKREYSSLELIAHCTEKKNINWKFNIFVFRERLKKSLQIKSLFW